MRILVVDDSNEKVGRLLAVLARAGIASDDISVAYTVFDGRKLLRDTEYDLLILDVLLPKRAGEDPDVSGTIDLLTEIVERTSLKKPRHIVGLTAYDEAVAKAGAAFVSRTWTVVKFAFESDVWTEQIVSCVRYIQAASVQRTRKSWGTSLCVVTGLASPEYEALMRLRWNWRSPEPLDDNIFVRRGEFVSGGKKFSVSAANLNRMGMVSAALLAAKMIEHEAPRFIAMAGICAGVKNKVNLGDVVVADPSWDWQSGKHFVDSDKHGFAILPEPIPLSRSLRGKMEVLRMKYEVWAEIRNRWPNPPDTELKVRVAPMASGSSVVADADVLRKIVDQNRNLTAVEMEAYGVVAAADFSPAPQPTALICKGVCDFGDAEKDDKWQAYAAYASAECLRIFFETYACELCGELGTRETSAEVSQSE